MAPHHGNDDTGDGRAPGYGTRSDEELDIRENGGDQERGDEEHADDAPAPYADRDPHPQRDEKQAEPGDEAWRDDPEERAR